MLHPNRLVNSSFITSVPDSTVNKALYDNSIDSSTDKPFIIANTTGATFEEIKSEHIIPVFVKDNEPLISCAEFIEITTNIATEVFSEEIIYKPSIRLSHPVKGRIPDAKDKPANQLEEWEKTIYYERMAFIIEIPSISDTIDGNVLSLTIGGIKAYSLDNMYNKKGADEHFKIFIGFQNKVCTNLCIWTDGLYNDLKVKSAGQLGACIKSLFQNYNHQFHIRHLKELSNHSLTEQQMAQFIGRCRMYQHLPHNLKNEIPQLLFGDNQIGTIVRDFYKDDSFCRMEDGSINLWRLYNLFTGANKSTYIDQFVERSVSAFSFIYDIKQSLQCKKESWYLQ
ncbi:DUF3871 family protein [soil metagenome]